MKIAGRCTVIFSRRLLTISMNAGMTISSCTKNGLLYTNGTEKAVTWMNSTANGRPVIPRTGYIVEVNALWYNALRFVADMVREGGNEFLLIHWTLRQKLPESLS